MYATKCELNDAPDDKHTNTVFYNRGIISGPTHSGGGVEDFVTETFNHCKQSDRSCRTASIEVEWR